MDGRINTIEYPLLLDGGLSNELERLGCNLNNGLWTAHVLAKNPETIVQAHMSYLKAGAQCITTANYQSSIRGFVDLGYSQEAAEDLIMCAVRLAETAISKFMASSNSDIRPLIAASIGPYGAYLADGSEYTGKYGVSDATLRLFHEEKMRLLDRSNADCFACETIPNIEEAKILGEIFLSTKKPAWMSFACKDNQHLNDGTRIDKCVGFFADHPNIFALGINCTDPEHISGLISSMKGHTGDKRIIAYPNSGEHWQSESKTWKGESEPESLVAMANEWLELGVDLIGGCCRIGPAHIKELSAVLARD